MVSLSEQESNPFLSSLAAAYLHTFFCYNLIITLQFKFLCDTSILVLGNVCMLVMKQEGNQVYSEKKKNGEVKLEGKMSFLLPHVVTCPVPFTSLAPHQRLYVFVGISKSICCQIIFGQGDLFLYICNFYISTYTTSHRMSLISPGLSRSLPILNIR